MDPRDDALVARKAFGSDQRPHLPRRNGQPAICDPNTSVRTDQRSPTGFTTSVRTERQTPPSSTTSVSTDLRNPLRVHHIGFNRPCNLRSTNDVARFDRRFRSTVQQPASPLKTLQQTPVDKTPHGAASSNNSTRGRSRHCNNARRLDTTTSQARTTSAPNASGSNQHHCDSATLRFLRPLTSNIQRASLTRKLGCS
jgi:hypothetical protein